MTSGHWRGVSDLQQEAYSLIAFPELSSTVLQGQHRQQKLLQLTVYLLMIPQLFNVTRSDRPVCSVCILLVKDKMHQVLQAPWAGSALGLSVGSSMLRPGSFPACCCSSSRAFSEKLRAINLPQTYAPSNLLLLGHYISSPFSISPSLQSAKWLWERLTKSPLKCWWQPAPYLPIGTAQVKAAASTRRPLRQVLGFTCTVRSVVIETTALHQQEFTCPAGKKYLLGGCCLQRHEASWGAGGKHLGIVQHGIKVFWGGRSMGERRNRA